MAPKKPQKRGVQNIGSKKPKKTGSHNLAPKPSKKAGVGGQKLLSPRLKFVFTDIFKDPKILRSFIGSFLDLPDEEYDDMSVTVSKHHPERGDGIVGAYDLKARTKSNILIYVESLLKKVSSFPEYLEHFFSEMARDREASGESDADIHRIINVVVTDQTLMPNKGSHYRIGLETGPMQTVPIEVHLLDLSQLG